LNGFSDEFWTVVAAQVFWHAPFCENLRQDFDATFVGSRCATLIARHSRVNASTNVKNFSVRLSDVVSKTKS
jgi:hypothetical protein